MTEETFNPENVEEFKEAFYAFLAYVKIDSKDYGPNTDFEPFFAQKRFLEEVFSGLGEDIHWFVVLKARQLGITTVSFALDLFWISYFKGLQGAIVYDTEGNRDKGRLLFTRMMGSLPKQFSVPVISHNKNGLVLANGSSIDYLVAGTKKNSGLGRSRAYNFLHATECSSWGDQEGLEALQKSLSDVFPARLYVFESTAKGYNIFYNMWESANEDALTKKPIFIGWWAKESYSFNPSASLKEAQLFERYAKAPISEDEQDKIDYVKEHYGFDVTMEQLAWYRYKRDPSGERDEGDIPLDSTIEQELPWHEEEAFMMTGLGFFPAKQIKELQKEVIQLPFHGYRYMAGENFLACTIEPLKNVKFADLKIWEQPDPLGTYVIGADPAYGSSDEADRFCAQVFKVYSDGMDQVAEFCTPMIKAYQFAWVLAHLAGAYSNARLLLELNGPGEAVFTEFRNLKNMLQQGMLTNASDDPSLRNILGNVKNYMYKRVDSFGGASAYHWKTNLQNKLVIFNQLRDGFTLNQIRLKSFPLLEEMQTIVQQGLSVRGDGNSKDDRVMAAALATRAWIDGERPRLQTQGTTREVVSKRGVVSRNDVASEHMQMIVKDHFSQLQAQREQIMRTARNAHRVW